MLVSIRFDIGLALARISPRGNRGLVTEVTASAGNRDATWGRRVFAVQ
jgi:hypothetical protein